MGARERGWDSLLISGSDMLVDLMLDRNGAELCEEAEMGLRRKDALKTKDHDCFTLGESVGNKWRALT